MTKEKTPSKSYFKKQIQVVKAEEKMNAKLAKFGRKAPAGRMWTLGEMQRFFASNQKKKK